MCVCARTVHVHVHVCAHSVEAIASRLPLPLSKMPAPVIWARTSRGNAPLDGSTQVEQAWHYFATWALRAMALFRHPAQVLLVSVLEASYQREAEQLMSASTTPMTGTTTAASSSTSTSSRNLSSLNYDELMREFRTIHTPLRGHALLRAMMSSMPHEALVKLAIEKGIFNAESLKVEELRLLLAGWKLEDAAASGNVAASSGVQASGNVAASSGVQASGNVVKPEATIRGADVVTFGRHKGKRYEQILHSEGRYASWVVTQTDGASPGLRRLAKYLQANGVLPTMKEDDGAGAEVEVEIAPEASEHGIPDEEFNFPEQMWWRSGVGVGWRS